jgi:hypothetical protein
MGNTLTGTFEIKIEAVMTKIIEEKRFSDYSEKGKRAFQLHKRKERLTAEIVSILDEKHRLDEDMRSLATLLGIPQEDIDEGGPRLYSIMKNGIEDCLAAKKRAEEELLRRDHASEPSAVDDWDD